MYVISRKPGTKGTAVTVAAVISTRQFGHSTRRLNSDGRNLLRKGITPLPLAGTCDMSVIRPSSIAGAPLEPSPVTKCYAKFTRSQMGPLGVKWGQRCRCLFRMPEESQCERGRQLRRPHISSFGWRKPKSGESSLAANFKRDCEALIISRARMAALCTSSTEPWSNSRASLSRRRSCLSNIA